MSAHLMWTLRRQASRLGWQGLAGLALLVFAIGFYLAAVAPASSRIDGLRADVDDLRARLKAAGENGITGVAPTRMSQLENFYAFFPTVQTLPDWLGQMHTAAARNSLTLESAEYQLQKQKGSHLARYQITLPVKGTYPQLRGFVSDLLEKVPAAALEDIVIKREAIGNPMLEARLKITIFLGAGA